MERIWSTHRLHRATKLPGDLEGRRVPGRIEAQRLHRRNVFNLARARRGRDRAHAQSPHARTLPDSRVDLRAICDRRSHCGHRLVAHVANHGRDQPVATMTSAITYGTKINTRIRERPRMRRLSMSAIPTAAGPCKIKDITTMKPLCFNASWNAASFKITR